jgi:putative sigma-54 modulation protein
MCIDGHCAAATAPTLFLFAQFPVAEEKLMNLHLTGHHLEITPAIRAYVVNKLDRVTRHFDHVIDVSVVLCVDKIRQIVEANVHVRGKEIHAQSVDPDMYAAIDALADKLDRQVKKHKEKITDHRCDTEALQRAADGAGAN